MSTSLTEGRSDEPLMSIEASANGLLATNIADGTAAPSRLNINAFRSPPEQRSIRPYVPNANGSVFIGRGRKCKMAGQRPGTEVELDGR